MTKQRLDEIEARLPKSEWKFYHGWGDAYNIHTPNTTVVGRMLKREDAEFVVQAAKDIRALLEAVRGSVNAEPAKLEWIRSPVDSTSWMCDTPEYAMGVYYNARSWVVWFIDDKRLKKCLYQGFAQNVDEAKALVEETFASELSTK